MASLRAHHVPARSVCVAGLLLLAAVAAPGQEALNEGLGEPPDGTTRSTPRAAVVGFLKTCRSGDFAAAAHYLDLRDYPAHRQPAVGARLARRFMIVLDRLFWVNSGAISNEPAGTFESDLAVHQERLTTLELNGKTVDVLLAGNQQGRQDWVWTFDTTTVAAIDQLYEAHGFGWLGDYLPAVFFSVSLWEIALWQWCSLAGLLIVSWLIGRLLAPAVVALLRRATRRTAVDWDDDLVAPILGPLRLAILALVLFVAIPLLHLAPPAAVGMRLVVKLAAIVILGWLLSSWVGLAIRLLERLVDDSNQVAHSFLPIFARVTRVALWVLVVVVGLDAVGFRVMGLVAGLGIGGLAVAFAAQRTIENLFGSLAIAADRPFKVDDFITVGSTTGTVEDVGLRSTRIRTSARTTVTIPNGQVMAERVENYSVRDRFLFNPTLGLLYQSTPAQLEYVIDEIKKLLHDHPKVYRDVIRVRLDGFGDSAINIGVFTWLMAADYHEYTALAEQLHFAMLRIVTASGTGFAFPSRTVYAATEAGIDAARVREIEAVVAQRRAGGDLWVPEPPRGDE